MDAAPLDVDPWARDRERNQKKDEIYEGGPSSKEAQAATEEVETLNEELQATIEEQERDRSLAREREARRQLASILESISDAFVGGDDRPGPRRRADVAEARSLARREGSGCISACNSPAHFGAPSWGPGARHGL
jgi:hypothetical protein